MVVVHWHASVPDAAHDEKDTFGFEALQQKNLALEKEVALRIAELVVKNRELEIDNNAFWACNERLALSNAEVSRSAVASASLSYRENYKPLVVVKTEQKDNQLIIKVSDNGTGITDDVKAKIFQPFFTTKPTRQGTGLGLSLSYDIVKGHGGELMVETKVGEGASFIIQLPL